MPRGGGVPDRSARRGLRYSAGGASVYVTCDDPELLDWCGQLFSARASSLDETRSPVVTVETVALGYSVTGDRIQTTLCHSRTDALVTLEHALSRALLYECRHLTQLHAAGAVVNGRALIALGGSGAGKSSLALGWTLAGCPSLGDDVVLLDAGGMTRPFPRHFKLDPEVLRSYGLEPEGTPFWNPDTREAWFTPSGISGWAESVAIGLVALCKRSIGAHVSLTPLPRSEGVNALLHSVLDTGLDPNSSFRPILDAMQGAQVVELRYGSAHDAARALAEYVA